MLVGERRRNLKISPVKDTKNEGEMWVDVGILIEGPLAGRTVAGYPD